MKPLAENKKAYFNYNISEKFEAGVVLLGQEVKSIKLGRMTLRGSYVVLQGEEVYLIAAKIPPYQPKNIQKDYNQERSRKLLLKKAEIKYLIGKVKEKGLTLLPLKVYSKRGKIKIEFGVAKGKSKEDKREKIKKRDTEREMRKALKGRG